MRGCVCVIIVDVTWDAAAGIQDHDLAKQV